MNVEKRTEPLLDSELSPPIFDDRANAYAQPVTPIPKSRSQLFMETVHEMFTGGARSLAFIVVLGLTAGTLAGMALVNNKKPTDEVAATAPASSTFEPYSDQFAEVDAGVNAPEVSPVVKRKFPRTERAVPNASGTRAYRFAVIR